MSDTCSLIPPFIDPWPSCLWSSQFGHAGVSRQLGFLQGPGGPDLLHECGVTLSFQKRLHLWGVLLSGRQLPAAVQARQGEHASALRPGAQQPRLQLVRHVRLGWWGLQHHQGAAAADDCHPRHPQPHGQRHHHQQRHGRGGGAEARPHQVRPWRLQTPGRSRVGVRGAWPAHPEIVGGGPGPLPHHPKWWSILLSWPLNPDLAISCSPKVTSGDGPINLGFSGGSDGKEAACKAGDLHSIPGWGRSPGEGNGNPLQYSCLENPHGQRSVVGYSPWGCKELDITEWLTLHFLLFKQISIIIESQK